eukprot:jgi/Ulvmu1/1939/UM012_0099.1
MDVPGGTAAPAEPTSPAPVRVDRAVRQSDVIGVTLAAVATLFITFAAILIFYFYRHRKLEVHEHTQKRKVRTPEAELSLGPGSSTDRSVLKSNEALRASAAATPDSHADVKVHLEPNTKPPTCIPECPRPQTTSSTPPSNPPAQPPTAPTSPAGSSISLGSHSDGNGRPMPSPPSTGSRGPLEHSRALHAFSPAPTDPDDAWDSDEAPGIESLSSVALLPPPPTSHTSSPSTRHATLLSTMRSSTTNASSSRGVRTPTTSPLHNTWASSPSIDAAAMSTLRSSTPSPPASPLSIAPATIMSTIREARARTPAPDQPPPTPPRNTHLPPPSPTAYSRSHSGSASATPSDTTSFTTSEDLTGSYTGSSSPFSSPSATPRSSSHSRHRTPDYGADVHATLTTTATSSHPSPLGTSHSGPTTSPGTTSASLDTSGRPANPLPPDSAASVPLSDAAAAAATAFAAVINDTGMEALTPPAMPPELTTQELQEEMLFLQYQLDCYSHDQEFLPGLILLGPGPRTRFYGESAIVQLAHNVLSGREVAIKVFATRPAFTAEAALLCNTASPLRGFMPALLALHDNPAGVLQGAAGAPLPPCIVMDKGEPLDVFCHLRSPSRSATFVMIVQISALLRDVHSTGYVHRDFKPSNVLWIDDKQHWAMVGFDQAAVGGQTGSLSTSTLAYTAPEVLAATCEGDSAMHVSPAIDAWSLGVVVLELLLAEPAFPPSSSREEVVSQILGEAGHRLPWEDPVAAAAIRPRLGVLRPLVLALLERIPERRLPVHAFVDACKALMRSARGPRS